MTWELETAAVGRATELRVRGVEGRRLTFAEVLEGWRSEARALEWSTGLAGLDEEAVHWELPALTRGGLAADFECVVLPNRRLARVPPEPATFAEHYGPAPVAAFRNLGGDSVLVAPRPVSGQEDWSHLLAFLRSAEPQHQAALWRAVSEAVDEVLEDWPLYLSTAGMGVYWLHVRLDPRPKYYRHAPYRR